MKSPFIQAEQPQQLEFKVEDTFKCPIYISHKPEWVKSLDKASDPIIKRVEQQWKKKVKAKKSKHTC